MCQTDLYLRVRARYCNAKQITPILHTLVAVAALLFSIYVWKAARGDFSPEMTERIRKFSLTESASFKTTAVVYLITSSCWVAIRLYPYFERCKSRFKKLIY